MTSLNKILIRAPNWVGDSVLAIPAMKALRAQFPGAAITLLARPWVSGLFTSARFIDRVWIEPRPTKLKEWSRITRDIRSQGFDLAVLFPNSFESALMVFLGRVPRRIGYAGDGRSWMLTDLVWPPAREQHQVHYYLNLARVLSAPIQAPSISIEASADERAAARKLLTSSGVPAGSSFAVLNPGAAFGSAKRWSEVRFAELADLLAAQLGFRIVVVGSEAERPIAERIRESTKCGTVVLNGMTNLETLIGILSESALMVTNDSGPMHLAAALGVPTVAIFGATNDAETGPYGDRTRVVKHPVECSPCMLRECPIDHRCMTGVTASIVCKAARELLTHA
jgi:heptosyltransferase-2